MAQVNWLGRQVLGVVLESSDELGRLRLFMTTVPTKSLSHKIYTQLFHINLRPFAEAIVCESVLFFSALKFRLEFAQLLAEHSETEGVCAAGRVRQERL